MKMVSTECIPLILSLLFLWTSTAANVAETDTGSPAMASCTPSDTLLLTLCRNTRHTLGVTPTPGKSLRNRVSFPVGKLLQDLKLPRAGELHHPRGELHHPRGVRPNKSTFLADSDVDTAKHPTAQRLLGLFKETTPTKNENETRSAVTADNDEVETTSVRYVPAATTAAHKAATTKEAFALPDEASAVTVDVTTSAVAVDVTTSAVTVDVTTVSPRLPSDPALKEQRNRVRRGVSPILPDNHPERQFFFSPSETCHQKEIVSILRPQGCVARVVRSSACEGTCHSRSVPQWDVERQELRRVTYCTCCKPHRLSYKRIRFRCQASGERNQVVFYLGVAAQCACRPCSDAEPRLRQPYDY